MSKNIGFWHFLRNPTINCFNLLHDDRGQHSAISGLCDRFLKNHPLVSRGLSIEKFVFWFSHDDRGQHFATSGLDILFQKK